MFLEPIIFNILVYKKYRLFKYLNEGNSNASQNTRILQIPNNQQEKTIDFALLFDI